MWLLWRSNKNLQVIMMLVYIPGNLSYYNHS